MHDSSVISIRICKSPPQTFDTQESLSYLPTAPVYTFKHQSFFQMKIWHLQYSYGFQSCFVANQVQPRRLSNIEVTLSSLIQISKPRVLHAHSYKSRVCITS